MMSRIRYTATLQPLLAGLALLLPLMLGGCASQPPAISRLPATEGLKSPARVTVVKTAERMLGTPYKPGGSSPRGFDCSGLVSYSYRNAGIHVPRTAAQQYSQSHHVADRDLQPGDLVFFKIQGRRITHVGIYLGQGQFVHAPGSGKLVSIDNLDNPYWRRHIAGAGHYF